MNAEQIKKRQLNVSEIAQKLLEEDRLTTELSIKLNELNALLEIALQLQRHNEIQEQSLAELHKVTDKKP